MGNYRFWVYRIAPVLLLAAIALVWCQRNAVLQLAGEFLIVDQPSGPADLIVILGGDFYGPRVYRAAELARQGVAKRVLISGPPYHEQFESDLAKVFLVKAGYPADWFISFRHKAHNTIEEATVLGPELKRLGAHRVLLVTSDYHSRRALWVFRWMLPGLSFRVACAPSPYLHPERWWQSEKERDLVLHQYASLLWSLAIDHWRYRWGVPAPLTAAP